MLSIREMGLLLGHYKIKRILLLMIIGILISSYFNVNVENVLADSTSYYVSNDGDNSNDGLSPSSPWKTIGKVNSEFGVSISAGDDIYFNKGDTFTDAGLVIGVSGISTSDPTVIGAYGSGALPIIDNSASDGIYIENKNYVTIENLRIQDNNNWIDVRGCSYITIQNCVTYEGHSAGGIYVGYGTGGSLNHIYIRNNTFENCGAGGAGSADVVIIRQTSYCLFENNTVIGGTLNDHACLVVRTGSDHVIVRNNTFNDGDDDLVDVLYATEYCVFENNIFNGTTTIGAGIKFQCGRYHILRNNIIYGLGAYGIGAYSESASPHDINDNKWYHNTIYNTGISGAPVDNDAGFWFRATTGTSRNIEDNIIKNNIFYSNDPAYQVIDCRTNAGEENHFVNNLWDNNIIFDTTTTQDVIHYYTPKYSVSEAESSMPSLFQDNIQANPLMTDPANYDFTLQSSSPCIDAGDWLTLCNGGGTGTTITVNDAGYFCDGFGLIDGDEITIGSDDVTITNVNYGTNQITVTPSITWINNDPVSLRYEGSAPDIGANEFVSSGPDTTPPEISNVVLTESNPLDTDPSFGWVNITCDVTDNIAVDEIFLNITNPDGSYNNVSMSGANSYFYNSSTAFSTYGNYSYLIWANDINGNPSTSTFYDFSMPPNWDINKDGQCTILDLTLIDGHYWEIGQNGWIREDVDNNGAVQVLDFVLVATLHYGETWWT